MHQGVAIIDLDGCPKAVRKFFDGLGDEPVILERDGRAVYVVHPASLIVAASPADGSKLAGEVFKDVQGTWLDIPDEVLEAIAAGDQR